MKARDPRAHDGDRPPRRRASARADEAPPARSAAKASGRGEGTPSEPRPALNAEWHARHPMPRGATMQQRLQWHLDHQRACGCRPIPLKLRALVARGLKPSREPWRAPPRAADE